MEVTLPESGWSVTSLHLKDSTDEEACTAFEGFGPVYKFSFQGSTYWIVGDTPHFKYEYDANPPFSGCWYDSIAVAAGEVLDIAVSYQGEGCGAIQRTAPDPAMTLVNSGVPLSCPVGLKSTYYVSGGGSYFFLGGYPHSWIYTFSPVSNIPLFRPGSPYPDCFWQTPRDDTQQHKTISGIKVFYYDDENDEFVCEDWPPSSGGCNLDYTIQLDTTNRRWTLWGLGLGYSSAYKTTGSTPVGTYTYTDPYKFCGIDCSATFEVTE